MSVSVRGARITKGSVVARSWGVLTAVISGKPVGTSCDSGFNRAFVHCATIRFMVALLIWATGIVLFVVAVRSGNISD